MLRALLLLPPLFLSCPRSQGVGGESLPAPLRPRFVAKTFHHELHWDPAPPLPGPGLGSTAATAADRRLYEVQYRWYGNISHWTPVPSCTGIARLTCDLSYETQDPTKRYHARVRAVAGPHGASEWAHTPVFVPKEATLWLSHMSLAVHNGIIRISVQLPSSPWGNITYEDLYPWFRQYYVYIRSVFNGSELVHIGNSTEFDLPALPLGDLYCVSVEPRVASRENPGNRTEEQCIPLLPLEEDHTRPALLIPRLALLSLPILGALVVSLGLALAYVKKPAKTLPAVLKSVLQRSSLQEPCQLLPPTVREVVLQVERDPIQLLSILGPKEQTSPNWAWSWGTEKHGWWLTWPAEGGVGMRRHLMDSSIGSSTDSGICLQEPSGSLSLGSSQEGGPLEDHGGLQGEVGLVREPKDIPQGGFPGYQKQAGPPLEAAACCGPPPGVEGTDHPKFGLVTSYLKQTSLGFPSGPGPEQGLSKQKGPGESGLLSC